MCDIHEKVTNRILDALRSQGPIPWRNSWLAHANAGYPINVLSNIPYRGINAVLLQMAANERLSVQMVGDGIVLEVQGLPSQGEPDGNRGLFAGQKRTALHGDV